MDRITYPKSKKPTPAIAVEALNNALPLSLNKLTMICGKIKKYPTISLHEIRCFYTVFQQKPKKKKTFYRQ